MKLDQHVLELKPLKADPEDTDYSDAGRMRVTVVYTTIAGTLAALEAAAKLARNLNAEIVLVVAEVVYFRYALEHPPISANFLERLCLALMDELEMDVALPATRVEIHFCRDQVQCLQLALGPRSLVVIGARKRWWNLREHKLERALSRLGHSVLLVGSNFNSRRSRAQSVARRLLTEAAVPSSR